MQPDPIAPAGPSPGTRQRARSFSRREQNDGLAAGLRSALSQGPSLAWSHGEHLRRRPAELGADRHRPLRARLPARLPAHRQPPRRRGPDPGGVRAGLPFAAHLHPGHHGGLAAPDHHEPLPRPGPPQAADPLRRAQRRGRRPAAERAADPRRGPAGPDVRRRRRGRAGLARPRLPGRRRALRRRGPQLRGDRRRARPQARHRPLPHPPRPRPAPRRPGPPRPDGRPHPLRRPPPGPGRPAGQVR